MDAHEAQLEAVVATNQHYVDNLLAALARPHLTAAKRTALEVSHAHHADKLARLQQALRAYREGYHEPPVVAVEVGPAPLPITGTIDQTYGCTADYDKEAFEALYGRSIETVLSEVLTGLLRPNLDRWQALVTSSGGTFSQQSADWNKNGDVTRQEAAIAFAKGGPFSGVASYFGGWTQYLGCADLSQLKDLGA